MEEDRLETRAELNLCSRLDYRIGCNWWASTLLSTPVSTYTVTLTHKTARESLGSLTIRFMPVHLVSTPSPCL